MLLDSSFIDENKLGIYLLKMLLIDINDENFDLTRRNSIIEKLIFEKEHFTKLLRLLKGNTNNPTMIVIYFLI
jgi:hypothetical protein